MNPSIINTLFICILLGWTVANDLGAEKWHKAQYEERKK